MGVAAAVMIGSYPPGYVDACLLAATMLTENCLLWTGDRRLRDPAARLDVAHEGKA